MVPEKCTKLHELLSGLILVKMLFLVSLWSMTYVPFQQLYQNNWIVSLEICFFQYFGCFCQGVLLLFLNAFILQ